MKTQNFTLVIERADGTPQVGFSLGPKERKARLKAEDVFAERNALGLATKAVAIKFDGEIIDRFDGKWGKPLPPVDPAPWREKAR